MEQPDLYERIQAYLQPRFPEYIEMLRHMVSINSFTANPHGVNALGELTAMAFESLGFSAQSIPSADSQHGAHLVLTRHGRSQRSIGMVSHLDTVFPAEEERDHDFRWRVAKDRLYGPGTVNIKGGTVMIHMVLAALRDVAPNVFDSTTWIVLLNAAEEVMAADFGALCMEQLGDALACLVFEGGRWTDGECSLVAARKGRAMFRVTAEGRAAHAGNQHGRGANAVVALSQIVQQVAALTDYKRQLTFNVGRIEGGTVANRVPHHAEALVEMRTFAPDVFADGVARMLALGGSSDVGSVRGDFQCQITVELLAQTRPWARNPATDRLLDIWRTAAAPLGISVVTEERGGLSDGNWVWQHIPTIDGLGPSGGNMHCSERSADGSKDQEYALASTFVPKATLNAAALLRLLREK
jgi:glutamate carboxypeptidase